MTRNEGWTGGVPSRPSADVAPAEVDFARPAVAAPPRLGPAAEWKVMSPRRYWAVRDGDHKYVVTFDDPLRGRYHVMLAVGHRPYAVVDDKAHADQVVDALKAWLRSIGAEVPGERR